MVTKQRDAETQQSLANGDGYVCEKKRGSQGLLGAFS
jgi:hypothetical protein